MGDIFVRSSDCLTLDDVTYRCAVGKNGFTHTPREGGKATPKGIFALRECWYRADRLKAPETFLPLHVIHRNDGWCDDPTHEAYNTRVTLPFRASHEELWREDDIYNIFVPIGFNDKPVVPGIGSAIFFHLAQPDYSPTLGCIAVALKDMLMILKTVSTSTSIHIMME